jgi:tRNA (cytosine38-C5)-methyltransferase
MYEFNLGNLNRNLRRKANILALDVGDLVPLRADLWLLSPSCQPYTVINPLAKDSADPRAKSFFHLTQNLLPKLVAVKQHPRYLLVENVRGFEVT